MKNMKTKVIHISISGPVGCGKSATAASIRDMLTRLGYCVATPDRGERMNPAAPIEQAAEHEKPRLDSAVIIITEAVE
jgi:Ni2+-binding GTPase involved in maturation of urease and hydrogenase